jgi:hypothetical protein
VLAVELSGLAAADARDPWIMITRRYRNFSAPLSAQWMRILPRAATS